MATPTKHRRYLLSPYAEALFPHLTSPDTYRARNGEGRYNVSLVLDPKVPEHARFLQELEETGKFLVGEKVELPIKDHLDRSGLATGKKTVKCSSKYAPKLYDRFNQPLPEGVVISSGSVIAVSVKPTAYQDKTGISLYLQAVQVKEIRERGAESYGFVADAPDPVPAEPEPQPESSGPTNPVPQEKDLPF